MDLLIYLSSWRTAISGLVSDPLLSTALLSSGRDWSWIPVSSLELGVIQFLGC